MKTYLLQITTLLLFIVLQGCVTSDLKPDSEKNTLALIKDGTKSTFKT